MTDAASTTPSFTGTWVPYVCAACSRIGPDLRRCAKCHATAYCNKTCQEYDWKLQHKKVCATVPELHTTWVDMRDADTRLVVHDFYAGSPFDVRPLIDQWDVDVSNLQWQVGHHVLSAHPRHNGKWFVATVWRQGRTHALIGAVWIRKDVPSWTIAHLYIHPAHRRQMHGTLLMRFVKDQCAASGGQYLTYVGPPSAFLDAVGFRLDGVGQFRCAVTECPT